MNLPRLRTLGAVEIARGISLALGRLDHAATMAVLDDLADTPAQADRMKMDYEMQAALANDRRRPGDDCDRYLQG